MVHFVDFRIDANRLSLPLTLATAGASLQIATVSVVVGKILFARMGSKTQKVSQ